jgi:GDP-L-fucose synthase
MVEGEAGMSLTNKKVLLTGGTGFLGKHVHSAFLQAGAHALSVGKSLGKLTVYDLTDPKTTEDLFWHAGHVDVVVHMAATVGGIGANQRNPGKFFYDNAMMGINVIETCRKMGVPKVVVVGTTCSYPKFAPMAFKEEDLWNGFPEETNSPYGISKRMLHTMLTAYRQEYGLNGIYLVPTNLYGPGDHFDPDTSHVIPEMIRKLYMAQTQDWVPTVWGTGTATRDFLYVKDAAEAIVKATELYDKPEPLNVGYGEAISIRRLYEVIAKIMNYSGDVCWDGTKPDGQPRRVLNIDRIKKEIGWSPRTTLEQGLTETIRWFKNEMKDALKP